MTLERVERCCGFFTFLIFCFSVLLPFRISAGNTVKLRCASIAPESSLFTSLIKEFSRRVERESGVRMVWYLGASVGDEIDIVRGLKKGVYDCAALTVNGLGFISSYFRALDLPFLIKTREEGKYLRKRVFPLFKKVSRDVGYEFLGFIDVGFVHIFSKHPIRTVDDFRGKRFWVWSGNVIQISSYKVFRLFGVKGVNITLFDVPAFEKEIDILWFPKYALLAYGWWRFMRYMIKEPFIFFMAGVIVRSEKFDALSDEAKEKIRKISLEFFDYFSDKVMEENERAERFMLRNGIKKVEFKDIKKVEEIFKEKMWNEFKKKYIPEWFMVSIIKELLKIRHAK